MIDFIRKIKYSLHRKRKLTKINIFRKYHNKGLYEINRILYFLNKQLHSCVNCGQELRGLAGASEIPTHVATESRLCSTGKYPETLAKWTTTKEISNRKLNA